MKFVHTVLFLSALCAVAGSAANTQTKSTAKKSTSRVSSTAKTSSQSGAKAPISSTAKKATGTTHVTSKGVTAKGKKLAGPPTPRRQVTPSADRYKEIQQALAKKGYLKEDATGVWDADSVAAMQHFQSDQKGTPTGKITAASLIGLGLGAKSAGAPEAPPLGGGAAVASPGMPPPAPPPPTPSPGASQ